MKLRIADRILVCVAGLILLACCAGILCQMFFGINVVDYATRAFASESFQVRAALIGLAVVLLLVGVYCVFVLFRHRKRKDRFVLQKYDGGELAISLRALENMVYKCLDQHEELKTQHLYLENRKDGLLIKIRGQVAGGISIPLTVEALQKQIRQYVTACSGVEIKGIRVQIESSGEDAKNAPFAIAAPAAQSLLHEAQEPPKAEETVSGGAAAEQPEVPAAPVVPSVAETPMPEMDEEDERALHQRLFSSVPEPCIVPEPPADQPETEEGSNEADPAPADAEPAEETPADEGNETEAEIGEEELPEENGDSPREADQDFVDSLKAFDDAVTGNDMKEAENDEKL